MVSVIKDKDLFNDIGLYDVILIGTNIYGSMSQGFQRKIMLNYPYVQEDNMKTKYGDERKLGTLIESKKEGQPIFSLLYICKGNFRPDLKVDYLSYESLEKCLKISNILYKGMNVACPFLGTSRFDGNGDKNKVLDMLSSNCSDINLTIYDYEQKSREEELKETYLKELELKKNNLDAYYEAVKKRKQEADKRIKNNGHARY